MDRIWITGRVGDIKISRFIDYYQPDNVKEQIPTAKRSIIKEFEKLGYKEKDVIFNI